MKRKVLFIIGKSDLLIDGEYSFQTDQIISKLQKRDDIELVVVGSYNAKEFDFDQLEKEISNLNPDQPLTVFFMCHGTYKVWSDFQFILDENSKVKSRDLFTMISEKVQNMPVDVFTPACHGGGILIDQNVLPEGSTIVALTDASESNSSSDFIDMFEQFDDFNCEMTAYNLLQFYLSRFLKNRFHPHIGVSKLGAYSLDDLLKAQISVPIEFDINHFNMLGCPENYKEVFNKIVNGKSEWSIYALEYGLALSILLNDLKNNGYLDIDRNNRKTM